MSDSYEEILKKTLMDRTGRLSPSRERPAIPQKPETPKAPPVPAAKKRLSPKKKPASAPKKQASHKKSSPTKPTESRSQWDILDQILSASDENSISSTETVVEHNFPVSRFSDQHQIMRKTLERKRGNPFDDAFSAVLDTILWPDEEKVKSDTGREGISLTETLYTRELHKILWPKSEKPVEAELPSIDEAKLKSLVAPFLEHWIRPSPEVTAKMKGQFLEQKYDQYYVVNIMTRLDQVLADLQTEYKIWRFLQNPDAWGEGINDAFLMRFRALLYTLLPQKKSAGLFAHTLENKDQKLIFDRMANSKFEDVRRILNQASHEKLTTENAFHLSQFLRVKLPQLISQDKNAFLTYLQNKEAIFSVPAESELVQYFLEPHFDEEGFLSPVVLDKTTLSEFFEAMGRNIPELHPHFMPLVMVAIELQRDKPEYFSREESQTLQEALHIFRELLLIITEADLLDHDLLQILRFELDHRAKALYFLGETSLAVLSEACQAQQSLYQELFRALQKQARESDKDDNTGFVAISFDIDHLPGYDRLQAEHQKLQKLQKLQSKLTQSLHTEYQKRSALVEKIESMVKQPKKVRSFWTKQLKSTLSRLQKKVSFNLRMRLSYEKPSKEALKEELAAILSNHNLEQDHEVKLLEMALQKSCILIQALNQSRSTVRLNFKLLLGDEFTRSKLTQYFRELFSDYQGIKSRAQEQTQNYISASLDIYFKGLKLKEDDEVLTRSPVREKAGYIAAYLAHAEQLKFLVGRRYERILFDFDTLFDLTHAIFILDACQYQPTAPFEELFRQTLLPTWDCLLEYCLLVGDSQYNLLANPLAVNDYFYQEPLPEQPLRLGQLTAEADEKEEEPSFGSSMLSLRAPKLQRKKEKELQLIDTDLDAEEVDLRKTVVQDRASRLQALAGAEAKKASPKEEDPPLVKRRQFKAPDSAPRERRILPPAPGKFEMYAAPRRRLPSLPEVPEAPAEAESIAPEPPETQDEGFYRPRGVSEAPSSKDKKSKRRSWLEITPSPEAGVNTDDLIDDLLGARKRKPRRFAEEDQEYHQETENLLRRNRRFNEND